MKRNLWKKWGSFLLAGAITLTALPYSGTMVYAQDETKDITTTEETRELSPNSALDEITVIDITNSNADITSNGNYKIIGKSSSSRISIAENISANIEFDNMQMRSPNGNMSIASGAEVYVTLTGDNIIQANQDYSGNAVNMAEDAELHFTASSTGNIILHGASHYYGGDDAVYGGEFVYRRWSDNHDWREQGTRDLWCAIQSIFNHNYRWNS